MRLEDYVRELECGGHRIDPDAFAITFDDGYEEVLTLGLPSCRSLGFTATVFAVPGELGGCNSWDDGGARLSDRRPAPHLDRAGSRSARTPVGTCI